MAVSKTIAAAAQTIPAAMPTLVDTLKLNLASEDTKIAVSVAPKVSESAFIEPIRGRDSHAVTANCTRMPHTDTPNITLASDTIFKTRAEAETEMKILKPCNQ
jgi:hypothetical protein